MKKFVITIGRQYGSGGKEVGERLAERRGIACYDKKLIAMAAQKGGFDPKRVSELDEKAASPWAYTAAAYGGQIDFSSYSASMNDTIQRIQTEIIRDLVKKESCIIVGRCADSILRELPDRLAVFIYSDWDSRIKRLTEKYGITEKEAVGQMKSIDKKRAAYYNYYTDKQWGKKESYDLTLNSGRLGIEKCVDILALICRD